MKKCLDCQETKPPGEFYHATDKRHRKPVPLSYCKKCHNARCHQRRRENPAYRARETVAKRAWERRNPERKRLHEGRLIFTHPAPALLIECERLVWALSEATQTETMTMRRNNVARHRGTEAPRHQGIETLREAAA